MARLSADTKADALLLQHRVRVLSANSRGIVCAVIGDTDTYRVRVYRDGGLLVRECTCEHGQVHPVAANCSHVKAVQRIYSPDERTAS